MKDRSDEWNRIERSETEPYAYENVAYGKGDKSIGKDGLLINDIRITGQPSGKTKLDPYLLIPRYKFQMKQKF